MTIYQKYIRFNISKLILIGLIVVTAILIYSFFDIKDAQYATLIGGLATGFSIATIQFIMSWYEYAKIDKYERLLIKDLKPDRDNRALYESLILGSKEKIIVIGSTATRLINDFADSNSSQDRNKALLTALSKGVKIKILVANKAFLPPDLQGQFDTTKTKFDAIHKQYSSFEFKYFNHEPNHSIFLADDDCILGPIFPGISSKNTPSIQVGSSSPFAQTYLTYFENEWIKCN